MIEQVAIIGVGLIGSSLGLALQDVTEVKSVVGIDNNSRHVQEALDIGAIDEEATLKEGVQEADLVVLAVPVGIIKDLVIKIAPYLNSETIITDVGSTKLQLVKQLEEIVEDNTYIGGHPMAGSEVSGPSGADKYLFENAIYALTKSNKTDEEALAKLKNLVKQLGAQPLIISPQAHDQIVGITSHLPHVVAVSLMEVVADYSKESDLLTSLIGGGFRDTTRISAGDPTMWKDIFLNNRDQVLEGIDAFSNNLAELRELIASKNEVKLKDKLAQIKEARTKIPMKKKGLLPSNYELILTLKDKPNQIGKVATLLGVAKINIQDIEVLKVRDKGGTVRLSFNQEEEQEKAYSLLKEAEYKVIKK
ncbi:prephenate dehydrogenase [Halobacteroides halobius DSM 5150]|uniref:Prephenate dehydrogenase n=1 Tax=Halobacteroides halobius (strain ATCC 35273 / DSM 5150 / MD-1) TaxID=748449 RepID=L0K8M4_HALHC|nr:prephenate dehydrogenase [Halobacteroides halobius]AGB41351.1 prephenate dehydrogenase [Halobacteroides halobius DSM 5150]